MTCVGQRPLGTLLRDTIVQVPEFLSTGYYLDGKRLNLPVMDWFMRDFEDAHIPLQGAIISDQLSVATYAAGGILLLTGALIREDNLNVSNDLISVGVLSSGAGLVFHLIELGFKRTAVERYNTNIKQRNKQRESLRVIIDQNRLKLSWRF